ncbi:MAG: hypothetical protein NC400_02210 [Clostridium sp.]|nr:hypothetical protein [Clostridium sp.]
MFYICIVILNNNLTQLKGGGQIIDFHVGDDGKPYITYEAGADTVVKKLGSGIDADYLNSLNWMYTGAQGTISVESGKTYLIFAVSSGADPAFKSGGTSLFSFSGGVRGYSLRLYLIKTTSSTLLFASPPAGADHDEFIYTVID